jgi:ATP-dependent helicase HrpA
MDVPFTKRQEEIGIHPLPDLPILQKRIEIIQKIKDNQVVVVLGETGCGKTTMVPLFLLEAGLGYFGKIGVTEPRRIAAYSLMPYVSGFIDSDKKIVGGHTRFWNTTNKDTQIEYMTDGILREEMLYDPELTEYSAIMIDEAHERSQNIDYILGHLKNIRKSRPELRIIIASATIDALKFSKFFDDAPIIEVPGRIYDVEVIYSTVPHFDKEHFKPRNSPLEVAQEIIKLHENNPVGNGIVGHIEGFAVGRDQIRECVEELKKKNFPDLEILPAYGHMDLVEQSAIFQEYPGKRKAIIGTNVLETSLTIPGLTHVIDNGLIKQMDFFANSGRSSLQIKPHSKSGLNQRKGRAGRMQNGVCIRLYTKEEYEALPEFTKPEICRTSLDSVILNMRYIGIQDVEHFPFIDLPSHSLFLAAYESLKKMGAMDKNEVLTEHGKRMAQLPLEPDLAHMLLNAVKYECVEQIATVVSAIGASHIMLRPPEEEEQVKADKAHERFECEFSDAITYLNIWDEYLLHEGDTEWCLENYMNEKSLIEMRDIRKQLIEMLAEFGIDATSTSNIEKILKAFALGLSHNLF